MFGVCISICFVSLLTKICSKKIVVDMMLKLSAKLLKLMATIELQDEIAPKENNREESSNFNPI
jgi:hypothetical protein